MILIFLAVFIVALIIANVLIAIKPKEETKMFQREVVKETQPEIIKVSSHIEEKNALMQGSINATNQKLNLFNERMTNLERAVSTVAEKQLVSTESEIDYDKIEFRIKVLEQQVDEIKNPKPKPKTFFGKTNDNMEETIKSLAFNSKKKTN